jgi:hypothetical protein
MLSEHRRRHVRYRGNYVVLGLLTFYNHQIDWFNSGVLSRQYGEFGLGIPPQQRDAKSV